ncbi:MAG: tryptophan synthase subunit alpha, partial [Desulfobacterales bacterium]|nr:tryptophan synthase subunit alpha [Desulfobacterales bacterium]
MLESYLRARLKEKQILLMTHIVLGYPTFEDSSKIVEAMIEAGVDLMEIQIPFSEPIADGPVILHANQKALAGGATVRECLDFAQKMTRAFDIPFLFMSYYNILFKYGVDRFVSAMAKRGLQGAIVPDLPPEEGHDYLKAMQK